MTTSAVVRIDVLFNNAAKAHFNWIEDVTEDEWRPNMRDEVDLVFFLTKAAWPHLKASGGTIVNTASLTGLCTRNSRGEVHEDIS